MSEQQKSNYMQELDGWAEATVIGPLFTSAQAYDEEDTQLVVDWENTVEQVKLAIRKKVLESYRNGQKAPKATAPARRTGGRYGR